MTTPSKGHWASEEIIQKNLLKNSKSWGREVGRARTREGTLNVGVGIHEANHQLHDNTFSKKGIVPEVLQDQRRPRTTGS